MLFNLIKSKEFSDLSKQLLNSNTDVVDSVFNTSSRITKQGIEVNRSAILSTINSLTSCREQSGRLFQQGLDQAKDIETRSRKVLDKTTDRAVDRVTNTFERVGNSAQTIGTAIDESLIESLTKIVEPTLDMLNRTSEQGIELSNKLLKTAARAK